MKRALVAVLGVLTLAGGAAAAEDNPNFVQTEITAAGVTFLAVADLSTVELYFDPPGKGLPDVRQPRRSGAPFTLVHGLARCFGIDLLIEGENVPLWVSALEKVVADSDERRPPKTTFVWGSDSSFSRYDSVITRIGTKYTLFSSDGQPLRATVSVRMRQAEPAAPREPAGDPGDPGDPGERDC